MLTGMGRYQAYPTELSRIDQPWTVKVKTLGPRACVPGLDEPACWLSEASLMSLLKFLIGRPTAGKGSKRGVKGSWQWLGAQSPDREAYYEHLSQALGLMPLLFLINTASPCIL